METRPLVALALAMILGGCVPPPSPQQRTLQNPGYAPAYPQYEVEQPQVTIERAQDIEENHVAICQHLRRLHPTVAPILVQIADLPEVVLLCHTPGDRFYDPLELTFPNAEAVLRLRRD
jgi:hypothetical protein